VLDFGHAVAIDAEGMFQGLHADGIANHGPDVNAGPKVQRVCGAFRRSESAALMTLAR
jgi:hypothetical protein